jgi:hypothetical protein
MLDWPQAANYPPDSAECAIRPPRKPLHLNLPAAAGAKHKALVPVLR